MDPMTIIVSVGFGVVGIEALLTAAVYRKALRGGGTPHATVSTEIVGESAPLSTLRRQRLRAMRTLHERETRPTTAVRPVPAPASPRLVVPVELTTAA